MTVLCQPPSLTVSPGFVTQLFYDLMQAAEMDPWWAIVQQCALPEDKAIAILNARSDLGL